MIGTAGLCGLLGVWACLIAPPVGPLTEPPPLVIPVQNPVEAARQRRIQGDAEFARDLARMEFELERMKREGAERDVQAAESTAKYHYVAYRARAIDLNRAATEYVRRATGFRLPNSAERLPVLK